MLRFIRMVVRIKLTILLSVVVGVVIAGWLRLREEHRTWGVAPDDIKRGLTGDDIVADAGIVETRSLVVDVPPSAVWPWLVQMGYGRGGWYSYDRMDMQGSSTRSILPEYQDLAVGDLVPTYPGGGFVARIVEPQRALVLYLDTGLVKDQVAKAGAEGGTEAPPAKGWTPPGFQMAGAMGDMTMPEFRVSWAFVLEPETADRTRLIERFRVWTADAGLPQKLGLPFLGYGVFAMTRKQMLGIKERAEAMAVAGTHRSSAAGNGSAPGMAPAGPPESPGSEALPDPLEG